MSRNTKGQFTTDPRPEKRKRAILNCSVCGKQFEVGAYRLKLTKKITCSRSCANVVRFTGKLKKKWSLIRELREGNPSLYINIHKKIYRLYGRPTKCNHCNVFGKKYYWANKTGKYLLDRDDWLMLCARCHYFYDYEKYRQSLK